MPRELKLKKEELRWAEAHVRDTLLPVRAIEEVAMEDLRPGTIVCNVHSGCCRIADASCSIIPGGHLQLRGGIVRRVYRRIQRALQDRLCDGARASCHTARCALQPVNPFSRSKLAGSQHTASFNPQNRFTPETWKGEIPHLSPASRNAPLSPLEPLGVFFLGNTCKTSRWKFATPPKTSRFFRQKPQDLGQAPPQTRPSPRPRGPGRPQGPQPPAPRRELRCPVEFQGKKIGHHWWIGWLSSTREHVQPFLAG